MMGFQGTPARLFYDFCLDDHVPSDHLLRGIDGHVDFEGLRQTLKPFYSQIGRPSIDPELMIRMLIVGYCMGIRSERRLCEEVHLNLAYRWFCQLGLDGKVPDHSTFSKNRHGRFRESDALRHLFESVVQRCMAEGLVSADGFAVDASLIAADANKQRSVPSRDWKPGEIKDNAVRTAREYLATLDDAAFGAASPVTPKFVSRSDPAAQWTGAHKGHAFFAYAANYLIDTDHGVIVDVEATRAIRQAEVGAARTMLERTETRFGMKPASLTADSAHGSADSLAWLVKRKTLPRTSRSSTSPTEPTARSPAPTSPSPNATVTPARRAKSLSIRTHLRHSQKRRHSRGHKTLSRQQIGLRHLQTQSPVLSERSRPQNPAGSARRRPRRGSCARLNAGICAGLSPSKENRDAIRAPQADTAPHASAIERSERSQRRVPPCGYCPKPETTRPTKADEYASDNAGRIAPRMAAQAPPKEDLPTRLRNTASFPSDKILDRFFNDICMQQAVGCCL